MTVDDDTIAHLWGLHQEQRPSGHSFVILLSHVSFLATVALALRAHRRLEGACLSLSALISIHYHFCDENFWCPYGLDIFAWHALDVWSTFFLICFVFAVMVLDLKDPKHRFILRTVYGAAVTGSVWYDRGSMLLFGGLLVSVAMLLAVRFLFFFPLKKGKKKRDLKNLVIGVSLFAIALGCFVVANTPVLGHTQYDPARDGPFKPMEVPDTSVYWIFHSLWHFTSAVAAYFVIKFLSITTSQV